MGIGHYGTLVVGNWPRRCAAEASLLEIDMAFSRGSIREARDPARTILKICGLQETDVSTARSARIAMPTRISSRGH